jgi:hypothetical protein
VIKKTFEKVEELVMHVQQYANNKIEEVKLGTAEKGSKLVAGSITIIVCLLIFSLFLLFISVAIAFALAKATGEMYMGFTIVAGFYLIAGVLVYIFRYRLLTAPIINAFLKKITKGDDEED